MSAAEKSGETRLGEITVLNPPEKLSAKAQAEARRRRRLRRLLVRLAVFVVLPTMLASVYFLLLASPQYESYALFSVQSTETRAMGGVEGLLAGITSGGGHNDALTIRDYVLSRDMLSKLDKEQGFIKHYQDQRHDWYSRLRTGASFEEAYSYFSKKVYADYDQASGCITVHVRTFDPEVSERFTRSILSYSEAMVNQLSDRERQDRVSHAEGDLKRAEERLSRARETLVKLQHEHGEFSPQDTAHSTMEIRAKLEGELARARAELMQKKAVMQDDAPQVLAAEQVVKSISAQVSNESRRLIDPSKTEGLGSTMADFDAGMVEKEFSQKFYQSAMTNLELARADANRQHRYLAIIASPSRPDSSTYPHRGRSILTTFFLSFLLLGIGSLVAAATREHARL
jgi:capsular polysaccharide transport system permease protein